MILRTLAYRLGGLGSLRKLGGSKSSDAVAIAMAHGVHQDRPAARPAPPTSSMSLAALKANLNGLERNYRFISMDEATEIIAGTAPWRPHCVALTFDDSLHCMADIVGPMLVERGIPATFYISTKAIESRQPYWWFRFDYALSLLDTKQLSIDIGKNRPLVVSADRSTETRRNTKRMLRELDSSICEQVVTSIEAKAGVNTDDLVRAYPFASLMTWADARRLCTLGMTLGSHSVSHPNFRHLPGADQRRELEASRRVIEQQCSIECRHFCYPYGEFGQLTPTLVRSAGYRSAVSTGSSGWNRLGDDLFTLTRFSVPKEHYKLAYVLSGWQNRVQRLRLLSSTP